MNSYCKNLKKGRPLAFVLSIVLVACMTLSVSAFAPVPSHADPGTGQVSLDTLGPVHIDWDEEGVGTVVNNSGSNRIPNVLLFWVDQTPPLPIEVKAVTPAQITQDYLATYSGNPYRAYVVDTRAITATQDIFSVDYF
jgi:hypothetical protein